MVSMAKELENLVPELVSLVGRLLVEDGEEGGSIADDATGP